MAIGYLDVFCGISGDMFLGALVDAGVDPDDLRRGLAGLAVEGWELSVTEVRKAGFRATAVQVLAAEAAPRPGHSHPPSHAPGHHHGHAHPAGHSHGDEHDHTHSPRSDHGHDHDHEPGHHHAVDQNAEAAERQTAHGRSADDIINLIQASHLSPRVAARSVAVVERLAEAEARCHGVSRQQVHFHELGGLDTIVDVVGTVLGLELLGLERLVCSPLPVTHGFVPTAHGRLAVPVPAVAELMQGIPTRGLDVEGETVTPTGAALAVVLGEFGPYPNMQVSRVGLGAGRKEFAVPNLLRLIVGETLSGEVALPSDSVVLLEANLDDMSPEWFGRAMDQAFAAGAVDVWATPIHMKKNRPATMISALAPPEAADAVAVALLRETTSFGVRRQSLLRQCLDRAHTMVETCYGPVRVKTGSLRGELLTAAPEYADCLALAERAGVALKQVYQAAVAAFWRQP